MPGPLSQMFPLLCSLKVPKVFKKCLILSNSQEPLWCLLYLGHSRWDGGFKAIYKDTCEEMYHSPEIRASTFFRKCLGKCKHRGPFVIFVHIFRKKDVEECWVAHHIRCWSVMNFIPWTWMLDLVHHNDCSSMPPRDTISDGLLKSTDMSDPCIGVIWGSKQARALRCRSLLWPGSGSSSKVASVRRESL